MVDVVSRPSIFGLYGIKLWISFTDFSHNNAQLVKRDVVFRHELMSVMLLELIEYLYRVDIGIE